MVIRPFLGLGSDLDRTANCAMVSLATWDILDIEDCEKIMLFLVQIQPE
jgi:hypothetical protein